MKVITIPTYANILKQSLHGKASKYPRPFIIIDIRIYPSRTVSILSGTL